MARTIGKIKIKKLKEKVIKVIEEEKNNLFGMDVSWVTVREKVEDRIPVEWFDTWESAWAEMHNIIEDTISDYIDK